VGALKAVLAGAALLWPAAANADPVDRWASEIAAASARFGVPEQWIRRVIRAESGGRAASGGRPTISPAGAMGLMQLMPGTWREVRRLIGLGVDPYDPHDNILAGTFYLRRMYDRFGYPGLFAAYNAGPARYREYLAGRRVLPDETRTYVAKLAPREGERIALRLPVPRPTAVAIDEGSSRAIAPAGSFAAPSAGLFVRLTSGGQ
jgi:soluble lytic murein transglycosylase-like protein